MSYVGSRRYHVALSVAEQYGGTDDLLQCIAAVRPACCKWSGQRVGGVSRTSPIVTGPCEQPKRTVGSGKRS